MIGANYTFVENHCEKIVMGTQAFNLNIYIVFVKHCKLVIGANYTFVNIIVRK